MEYTKETINELANKIAMAISINDDTLFGYPAQVYYDNKDEPEFYLGI